MKKILLPLFALAVASALADTPITDRAGLAAIGANAESLAGSYALGADIDLDGTDWTPLGTDSAPFTGEFHGNGHAIRNLVCTNNPSGNSCRGLFGCASNATIDSVSVSGTVAGKQYVGGLVGRVRGGTIVSNCSAAVEVAATGSYAGGLIGWPSAPKRSRSGALTPIASVEDLLAVRNDLAGRYVLVADIDFEGATIEPLGDDNHAFTGGFYGRNHKISGFSVDTMNRYAGLFGKIAGGRVSGVQAEGDVTGSYEGSGSDAGVGGFAGKIDSKSLVDGCSFDGWIENTATYNAGGFVGYTADSPAILRCCVHVSVANGSGRPNTGGFIGNHGGGSIMDCYAEAEVEAGGSYVGGFAGFVASSARIAASWCSGQVDATDTYRGAFVGQANGTGLISNSYYDTSANGQMEASGTSSPRGSAAYAGIAPLDADDMTDKASFPVFDFIDTWIITEADGAPQLRTFFSAYELWLKDAGIAYEPEPEELVNGIPAGLRYVYDIPSDATNLYALPGEPFFRVVTDAGGNPCVKFRAKRDSHDGVEAREIVEATADLADWTNLVPMRHNAQDDTWKPDVGVYPDQMFFRWKIDLERSGN